MAWSDDKYTRRLLDGREKWGTVLSLTAIAATLLFLADHPHRCWLNLGPIALGALGSLYVLVVNCYYEQAAAMAEAKNEADKTAIRSYLWVTFARQIGFLGWLNIVIPLLIGVSVTIALCLGIDPPVRK